MPITALLPLALLFPLPFVAWAETACTRMGCESGVYLEPRAGYRWAPGSYRFHFVLDGREISCTARLPLPACGERAVHCSGEAGVLIEESGCALPRKEHAFGRIHFPSAPKKVKVEVFRGGKKLGALELEPDYTEVRPNGPSCEPVCRQAKTQLLELR